MVLLLLACASDPCEGEARPETLDAFAAHADTLPGTVDAACVLHSLARPLQVEASRSLLSAQPGTAASPRLFVFSSDLVLSIVPSGVGEELLEFGEVIDATHSIKAELHLPLELPLSDDALFERIRLGDGSNCAACHNDERPDLSSVVIRPEDDSLVPLDDLRREVCRDGSPRCRLLDALFAGPVEHHPFDPSFPTFPELGQP